MSDNATQKTPTTAELRYVDRPDLAETFADAINSVMFDGQSMRIELGVTRLDDTKPNTPFTGRRYPAARLVLSPAAAVDLINRMQQTAAALAQAGVLKVTPTAAPESSVGMTTNLERLHELNR
jgi:hypothetical protein